MLMPRAPLLAGDSKIHSEQAFGLAKNWHYRCGTAPGSNRTSPDLPKVRKAYLSP